MTKHFPTLDVSIDFDKDNLDLGYSKQCDEFNADGLIIGPINLNEESRKPLFIYDGEKPLEWVLPLVNELKKTNKKVILSFGGGYGSDIDDLNSNDLNNCFNYIIQLFKPNQIDLNLDSGLYNPDSIDLIFKSIKDTLEKKENSDIALSISLPIKPSMGLGEEELEIVKCASDNQLNFILNGLYSDILNPDYSSRLGEGAIESLKKALEQLKQVYPNKSEIEILKSMAATPMIGLNNNSTMFTFEDTQILSKFAAENCLAFTSFNCINRDHPPTTIDNKYSSNNPKQTTDGQYTKLFVSTIKKDDRSI